MVFLLFYSLFSPDLTLTFFASWATACSQSVAAILTLAPPIHNGLVRDKSEAFVQTLKANSFS